MRASSLRLSLLLLSLLLCLPVWGQIKVVSQAQAYREPVVSTTSVGTTAVTTAETLWSYTVTPEKMAANGDGIRVNVWGITGANANNKTLEVVVGTTAIKLHGPQAMNAVKWSWTARVYRTGAGNVAYVVDGFNGSSAMGTEHGTMALDVTANFNISFRATNGTAVANDVVLRGALVEFLQ